MARTLAPPALVAPALDPPTPAALRPKPRRALWAGRLISGLVAAFFVADGAIKLVPLQPVIDTLSALGWPTDRGTLGALGWGMLAIAALYVHPRTALLGAILMTGYLGGAVATHARIGSPLLSHVLFGVYVGILAWAGLWLRRPSLRAALFGSGEDER